MGAAEIQMLVLSAVVNAALTWGIVKTQLAWLRRDVDELRDAAVIQARRA